MSCYTLDVKPMRTAVIDFLGMHRNQLRMYGTDNDYTLEDMRLWASRKGEAEKEAYLSDILTMVDVILNALVYLAVGTKFNSVPKSYRTAFYDLTKHLYVHNYRSSLDTDDATLLFDDLYLHGVNFLDMHDFDPNALVEFKINHGMLQLEIGMDYRIAIFNQVFTHGWNGPVLNTDGTICRHSSLEEINYLQDLIHMANR